MMDFTECYADTVSRVAAVARSGHWRHLRRLIQRGCSVEQRDNRGWCPLHESAAAGRTQCVRDILSAIAAGSARHCSAYVNSLTHEGESACFLAAQLGHLSVLRLLLKAHADIDQQTNDGSCPLFAAVDAGHAEVVELLVSEGAEVNGTHTASCWTCLHQAVYKGHSEIVRILVGVCDLEALDDHRITPVFVAAQYGRPDCLRILINAGANVNVQVSDLATPLLIACQEGHGSCVDLLLDHGADPNVPCSNDWPQLPVHAAAQFGHVGVLRRLIAVTDRVCDRGDAMVSPLYVAVVNDQIQSVKVLLGEGFSPDAQDCRCLELRSPLQAAINQSSKPYSESVKLLVAAGANIGEETWTSALATDDSELLQLILEHRRFPRPEASSADGSSLRCDGRTTLKQQEVRELLCAALTHMSFSACWLPVLLKTGLEPSLLLQPHMLERWNSAVLNFLLEFVNWSTLSVPLKLILDQRRAEKSWDPRPQFEFVPCLSHLCRLQVRSVLGPDLLMRTGVVQQLPVPALIHNFLQFKDVLQTSLSTHSTF
ncbi:ankyrin repeat and SOCS box protein 3-like isoform X2 [Solea solea]|uniref:ankyrin repeat and SOCS box protein 3-like isoform X2 n=1 Tax=Solea solea TaxID=90069 RepID=UPI00272A32D8|nr:ankyrin repeat and SOCS box protein 3-like isoform X2 [Solea solea]